MKREPSGERKVKWKRQIHNELNWKITQLNIHIQQNAKVETWMLSIEQWKNMKKTYSMYGKFANDGCEAIINPIESL